MPSRRSSGASTGTARSPRRMPATATRSITSTTLPSARTIRPTAPCRSASIDAGLVLERRRAPRGNACRRSSHGCCTCTCRIDNQDDLPVFDTAIPDLNLVQLFRTNRYVGADRVGDANQMSVGVTTRLLDARTGRQFLSATLGQAYYFEDPRVRLPDETPRDRSHVRRRGRGRRRRVQELERPVRLPVGSRRDRRPNGRRPSCSTTRRRAGSSMRAIDSGATCSSSSTSRRHGRSSTSGAASRAGCIRCSEEKTLDQFVGFEYSSCCWAVRFVTRRFVSSRTGDSDTSFGMQLELKGLSSVGVDNEAFLRDAIRGYSAPPVRAPVLRCP